MLGPFDKHTCFLTSVFMALLWPYMDTGIAYISENICETWVWYLSKTNRIRENKSMNHWCMSSVVRNDWTFFFLILLYTIFLFIGCNEWTRGERTSLLLKHGWWHFRKPGKNVVKSFYQWIYCNNYNQRFHTRRLCKKSPLTQAHYVSDNKPDCGWFTGGSSIGTSGNIRPRFRSWKWFQLARIHHFNVEPRVSPSFSSQSLVNFFRAVTRHTFPV